MVTAHPGMHCPPLPSHLLLIRLPCVLTIEPTCSSSGWKLAAFRNNSQASVAHVTTMVQWDDARLLACARGELSMTGDMTMIQQTTPLNSSSTGLYARLTTLTPPALPQEHLKLLQQAGVDATWIPDSVEHSSLYEDNILKLTGGSWVRVVVISKAYSSANLTLTQTLKCRYQTLQGCPL